MIRPFTFITMLLAALSGAYLFAVKHRAQVLDDNIAAISQESRLDVQRIRVLQAQWAADTDPTRVQQLASQFTNLQPMRPSQLVTLAALREVLPPPGSAAPGGNPALPEEAAPGLSNSLVAEQGPASSQNLPLPPPQAPAAAMVANLGSEPQSFTSRLVVARPLTHRIGHSALHIANTEFAESLPAPKPYDASRSAPVNEIDQTVPMGAQLMSVKASTTVPQYASIPRSGSEQNAGSAESGSALGMAADIAPPQPLPPSGMNN